MTTVFVYGTLKRGGSNHAFLASQRFLGEARTVPGFILYSLGDYPGMVRAAGDTAGVTGELWEITDACLEELDQLEGLEEGLYSRINVSLLPNPFSPAAQTYLYARPHQGLAPIGDTWPVGSF